MTRSLLRQIIVFERGKMDARVAARNAVGVALSLYLGSLTGDPAAGLAMSMGAINGAFADAPDAYVRRARRLVASCFISALAVLTAVHVAGHPWLVGGVACAWGFLVGLLTLFGTVADLAMVGLSLFIIFAVKPYDWPASLRLAGFTFLGGLVQLVLSVGIWPLRRFEPERRELGKLYLELARLATVTLPEHFSPPGTRQFVRAHETLSSLPRDRNLVADRYRSLLSQGERIRLALLSLARLKRRADRDRAENAAKQVGDYLNLAARILGLIAEILLSDENGEALPPLFEKLSRVSADLREGTPPASDFLSAALRVGLAQMDSLGGQLRAAAELAARATPTGMERFDAREQRRPWRLRFTSTFATLRANLTFDSIAFRHGVRLAVGIGIGEAMVSLLRLERAYWLPMTIVIVMRPEYASTLSRGLLRVGGTIAGLVVATVLLGFLPHNVVFEVAATAACIFCLRWVGLANYGIFAFFITGMVVMLLSLTGVDPRSVIWARGLNTALGGGIALLLSILWPTLERSRVRETLARMIETYRDHFIVVAKKYSDGSDLTADETRIASRVARSNLEASFERLEAEPGLSTHQRSLLRGMLASSNRIAHASMSLDAAPGEGLAPEDRAAFAEYARAVESTLTLIAAAARDQHVAKKQFPDLRATFERTIAPRRAFFELLPHISAEADHMTNSLNTLRSQVSKWEPA